MAVHHHGYVWVGSGSEYGNDSQRRPLGTGFGSTSVAPIEPANWLLKPRKMIKGTFKDTGPALEWYSATVRQHLDRFDEKHIKEPGVLDSRLAAAREALEMERDVVGGWWGNGGSTFYAIHLIACPNFWRPEHPCPEGLR
ncbi:hypothetical protein BJP40_06810 [Streptomyces sp. CC53]|uniref:hypothetical protein n=1 Tax=Streptomyces sp. CC53 TaxID=1906740 RepID=UPI0008DDA7EC|nr:hypothetical protein [Streptomyces sp. CC53]OII61231.1 hypothetical protein BJP40_06810 [Streptomyces sp. CC53]